MSTATAKILSLALPRNARFTTLAVAFDSLLVRPDGRWTVVQVKETVLVNGVPVWKDGKRLLRERKVIMATGETLAKDYTLG